jgi:hypothetical protein
MRQAATSNPGTTKDVTALLNSGNCVVFMSEISLIANTLLCFRAVTRLSPRAAGWCIARW